MKVGIFETEHFEVAGSVIKLFDNGSNDITVFTYEEPYEQLLYLFPSEPKRYEWKVKPRSRSKYLFILDMYKEIKKKKISLVYLDTISNNFIIYAFFVLFLGKVRVVLTIHNINTQFELKKSLSPRRIVRYLGRKMLLSVVKEFNVLAMAMIAALVTKLPTNKKIHCVPGAVFEENLSLQMQPLIRDHVNIVIPGAIDGRRRDYEQALALLQFLEQKKIPSTITFLGRFYDEYGKTILEKARAHHFTYALLKYYEFEVVAQPEFDRVMNEASFIFIPSVLTTILEDGVTETYGSTLSSGNLFDVVRHAKPFIIPSPLAIDPFLEKSCFRYRQVEEIATFIATVQHDPSLYLDLQQAALEASRNYTIEKVRERNASLFIDKAIPA